MTHQEYQSHLDEFVDGTLDEQESRAMRAHASACAECAALLAATIALVEQSRGLDSVIEPTSDAWPRLEKALQVRAAGIASGDAPRAAVVPLHSHAARGRSSTALAWLVAASLAICAVTLWSRSRPARRVAGVRVPTDSEAAFSGLLSGLELECLGAGQSLQASFRLPAADLPDAALATWTPVLSDAVAILDRSIAETRSALERAPDDVALQTLLASRYRQKLAILNAALVRVDKV